MQDNFSVGGLCKLQAETKGNSRPVNVNTRASSKSQCRQEASVFTIVYIWFYNICLQIILMKYLVLVKHLVPSPQGKQMGRQWKQCQTLFFGAPKSLWMVTAAMKLKDAYSLEGKLDQPRQHIKKQRHYFANKGPSSQGYGFSSGHVWM